jgi:iron complex outermembrane receptor protein
MRKLAPIALSAIALLALAGCAGGGNGGGGDAGASSQSVQEACSIAQDKLSDAQSKLSESMSAAASGDSEATTDLFETVQKGLDDALAEITRERWRLSLNATNLFDRRGYASCLVRGDCFTNAPRNVMLSLRYGI